MLHSLIKTRYAPSDPPRLSDLADLRLGQRRALRAVGSVVSVHDSGTENGYIAGVNRAVDAVLGDLAGDLRLERLASAAGFSTFHFHRVFKSVTGETLAGFVGRVRLERAIRMMAHGDSTLTDIAVACGFGTLSSFSRAFRGRYGVPPSAYDPTPHLGRPTHERRVAATGDPTRFDVKVRPIGGRTVLYRRVTNPYQPGRIAAGIAELSSWVKESNIEIFGWMGYSWDDPDIVDSTNCRYDIAVEVAAATRAVDPFGVMSFGPTLVAEIDVLGSIELEQQALDWLFDTWLRSSSYIRADLPTFEVWHGYPAAADPRKLELTIQLPVTRISDRKMTREKSDQSAQPDTR